MDTENNKSTQAYATLVRLNPLEVIWDFSITQITNPSETKPQWRNDVHIKAVQCVPGLLGEVLKVNVCLSSLCAPGPV